MHPLEEIWGGMSGEIRVIHSAWNIQKEKERILANEDKIDTVLGRPLADFNLEEQQVDALFKVLLKYRNLLIEGDTIALDHVLSVLRFLYDPEHIKLENGWSYGSTPNEVRDKFLNCEERFDNIILVCGPGGNLVTSLFLQKLGLSWLFGKVPDGHSIIRTDPDPLKSQTLSARYKNGKKSVIDHGVFIKGINPFNNEKKIYAVMGLHAYGTQGAAAAACSLFSVKELLDISPPAIKNEYIQTIAWVEISTDVLNDNDNENADNIDYNSNKLQYKIVYPHVPRNKIHSNPGSISFSQSYLRTSLLQNTVFLGAKPVFLVLYSILLFAMFFSVYLISNRPILITVFIILAIVSVKLFISLIGPPNKML